MELVDVQFKVLYKYMCILVNQHRKSIRYFQDIHTLIKYLDHQLRILNPSMISIKTLKIIKKIIRLSPELEEMVIFPISNP